MADKDSGKNDHKLLRRIIEVVLCLMIAIVLVGLVQQFFLAPVAVSGSSMLPTFSESGDKVFVQKKFFKVSRGDVVVFYRPNSDSVTSKNPSNSISFADFFNSLPFINKIPKLKEDSDSSADYTCVIKRVIGVEGDHIQISFNGGEIAKLYRNGKEIKETFIYEPMRQKNFGMGGVQEVDVTVGKGELFVLGDNRNNSYDSEDYGCIKTSWLMGKVSLAKIDGKYRRKV